MEPQYAFSIPSVGDDIALDCRIYHPSDLIQTLSRHLEGEPHIKGAIVAHPYAPLGGCHDDHVVLAVTQTLLDQGYVVGTFNFRGAGDSAGHTSWTGKPELQDYISFVGFMIYYLHRLSSPELVRVTSKATRGQTRLLLGGYSYGALVLARFPPTTEIIDRFEAAERGTSAAEIILRAQTLAKQTRQAIQELQTPASPRGRSLKVEQTPTSPSKRASPMTMGGEETDPSERRRSRDSRRSADVIRKSVDMPHRLKAHIKHRHASREMPDTDEETLAPSAATSAIPKHDNAPSVATSYLFISPVLLPFSSTLLPPGAPTAALSFGKGESSNSSKQFLQHPALTIFGSNDAFTSSKRLRQWAEKQEVDSQAKFQWSEIEGAGHFWGEAGVLQALQERVVEWNGSTTAIAQQHEAGIG